MTSAAAASSTALLCRGAEQRSLSGGEEEEARLAEQCRHGCVASSTSAIGDGGGGAGEPLARCSPLDGVTRPEDCAVALPPVPRVELMR